MDKAQQKELLVKAMSSPKGREALKETFRQQLPEIADLMIQFIDKPRRKEEIIEIVENYALDHYKDNPEMAEKLLRVCLRLAKP